MAETKKSSARSTSKTTSKKTTESAPKSQSEALRRYEVMVIFDPDLEERTIAPGLDNFCTVIRSSGGAVEKIDVWGRRRLAYEINKRHEGIYAVVDLNAEPAAVAELDRQLKLTESIMRTKVLQLDSA